MNEIIDGFPLYSYYICMSYQFVFFPLLTVWFNQYIYKTAFIVYMIKDFYIVTMPMSLTVHHVISCWGTYSFCDTQQLCWLITVGEIGSGMFNVYTLANYYDFYVFPIYLLYSVIMTLTNIYCWLGLFRKLHVQWYYKVPIFLLLYARQYFVYVSFDNYSFDN